MIKSFLAALLTVLSSGCAFYFSTEFHHVWFLAWVAPIPVLLYAYRENFSKTLWISFLVGLAPGLNEVIGYWPTLIPSGGLMISMLVQSIEWTLVVLLTQWLMKRMTSPFSILAYPTCLALSEWLESLTLQGTFNTIAYSQLPVLPVIQIASVTGYMGISFVLGICASSITYAIIFWKEKKKAYTALFLGFLIVIANLSYGFYRLHEFTIQPPQAQIKVGLVSISYSLKKIFNPQSASAIISAYQPLIQSLVNQGAELIILPEEAFSVTQKTAAHYQQYFSLLAKTNHVQFIVGVHEQQEYARYNSAWVFDQQGKWLGAYHKRHFVPHIESSLTAGTGLFSFPLKNTHAGIAICRDMDYPNPAKDYGALKTQILFVPAWDFDVDAEVHAAGARMRGIENGYTVVRVARAGLLSVSTPTGALISKIDNNIQGTTLITTIPIFKHQGIEVQDSSGFVILLWVIFVMLLTKSLICSQTESQCHF